MFGSGNMTLIISNEEMNGMKIVKSLEESSLVIKRVSKTINNEQKGGFLGNKITKRTISWKVLRHFRC